ncbi:WD40 repeat-like protein [Russula earlei]|uniref:WD40 repeat-like protein n=1 Tax=Russula earlei TaxID=71964 RepID=A0ACC0U3A7_9AGAM|nr:WD40 repeat-like protein [Russula earlei]
MEESIQEREDLVYALLASLPRSSLANIQKRIVPLLQLDVVGLLPTELALHIFSYLPSKTLLQCGLVSRRWRTLADDYTLWKRLCTTKGWYWKNPPSRPYLQYPSSQSVQHDTDDEGMGDEEIEMPPDMYPRIVEDSGFASDDPWEEWSTAAPSLQGFVTRYQSSTGPARRTGSCGRIGARKLAARLPSPSASATQSAQHQRPNYKLLHLTRTRLQHRFLSGSYRLSTLLSRGTPGSHANTIYCLQLYTYLGTGNQVLFTGSKDRTIKEWDLTTGAVLRTIQGVHEGSVLSICVHGDYLASAGSDSNVVVWDLVQNRVVKVIDDHEDSVLCVRFDDARLVSCSKDRTVRTYLFPDLDPLHIMTGHRAAVNALSVSPTHIVSASGDRSLRLWDANTGALLRTFENHHSRGIASIDLDFPIVLSGSSDKHIRLFNLESTLGWSTSSEFDVQAAVPLPVAPFLDQDSCEENSTLAVCHNCGVNVGIVDPTTNTATSSERPRKSRQQCAHSDLVRNVALSANFVVSGSYDFSVKVWDRKTGRLVTDLVGGHIGRIFSVGFDCTKVVSCGEDQRICIWDFGYGMDTSFVSL